MTDTPNIVPSGTLSPRTIVGIYAAVGTTWIVLSDNVMAMFTGDLHSLRTISIVKGALFIIVTSLLLHALIRRFAGEIRLSRDIFSKAFSASPDSVTITRVSDGSLLHVNEGFGLITGYGAEDLKPGFRAADLWVDPLEREKFLDTLKSGETVREMEAAFRTKEGQIVGLVSACGFELAGELCVVSVTRDITEEKRRAEEMRRLANYDGESGLPNMTLLVDRLNQTLAMDGRNKRGTGVVSIRLENFEDIVDALGHGGGTEVVRTVSERLSGLIRQSDTLARVHREEYVIVIGGSALESDIDTVLNKLVAALGLPVPTDRGEVMVSAFVGIACFPSDGLSSEVLLQNARRAMSQARERGERGCHFFSPVLNDKAVERRLIETSMLRALDNGEFFLCYQPKYAVDGLRLTGMEALLRWRHPGFGDIPPARFIPIAEKNGMILDLGLWVLRTACRQNREWQDAGLPALPVSVNISGRQLLDNSFVDQVASVLAETGLSPHLLELELTESVVMGTADGAVLKLLRLRDLGIRIAIDDFGTGYSSLSYLSRLPIDRLKIDRSFVMDLAQGSDSAAIIDAVIAMADSLKLKVTAEGVETREQYDYLAGRRCDELQGFLFSHPLDTPHMERLLREGNTVPRLPEPQRNAPPAGPVQGENEIGDDEAQTIPEYLGEIAVAIPPIAPGETITEAWRRFQEKADLLALPVVDRGEAVGVVKRFTFFEEHIIGKHGFGIHINHSKKILDLMAPEVVVLEAGMRIRDVAQAMHSMKMGTRLDNICVAVNGVYSGIIEVSRLANAVAEINLLLARNANPLTGLSGNDNIQREINGRLSAGKPFDIAYVDIDNFKPYNDHYGFQKGDVVIRALAEVIERTAAESGSFCGHIGGDDFIVITEPFYGEKMAEAVIAGFEEHLPVFHGDRDFAYRSYTAANRRGEEERFALLSLSIGIVNTRSTPVESYAQLASLATEVKKAAKRRPGSSVVVDGRGM